MFLNYLSIILAFPWKIESKLHSKSGEVAVEDTVGEEANFFPCYIRDFTLCLFVRSTGFCERLIVAILT